MLLGADVTYVNMKHKNKLSNITFYDTEHSEATVGQKTYSFTEKVLIDVSDWCGLYLVLKSVLDGFGGIQVACWPLVLKFVGSNLAEAVGFFGRKNPQHAFLRRESKAVCPISCFTACKRTQK
jgi:hypothetical protein